MLDRRKDNYKDLEIDDSITKGSFVKLPGDSGQGFEDLVQIQEDLIDDRNVYKLSFGSRLNSGRYYQSWLHVCGEIPYLRKKIKKDFVLISDDEREEILLYIIVSRFLYHYTVAGTSVKGQLVDAYCRVSEGLLGFRGALSWREAGVGGPMGIDEKKQKKIDKILSK